MRSGGLPLLCGMRAVSVKVPQEANVTLTGRAGVSSSTSDTAKENALFEVYGPVALDSADQRYIGATQHTNSTAELTAIAEALIWLNTEAREDPRNPAVLRFDSQYAAEAIQ